MKRMYRIAAALFFAFCLSACSLFQVSGEGGRTAGDPGQTAAQNTQRASQNTSPVSQNTQPAPTEGGDFQQGIPEEFRLKRNVPKDWKEPLPEQSASGQSSFFAIVDGASGDSAGSGTASEPVTYPKVKDLFTLEELEEFFRRPIVFEEDPFTFPNSDSVSYDIPAPDGKVSNGGYVTIRFEEHPNSAAIRALFGYPYSENQAKIEGLGIQAITYNFDVMIQVTDTGVLSVAAKARTITDEDRRNFAGMVYDRFMEKVE